MKKLIALFAILFLALASATWAGHHNSLSITLGTSMGTKGPHGPSMLMETSGYILNETGGTILLDP